MQGNSAYLRDNFPPTEQIETSHSLDRNPSPTNQDRTEEALSSPVSHKVSFFRIAPLKLLPQELGCHPLLAQQMERNMVVAIGCPREWESGYIFRNKEYPITIELIGSREGMVGTVYGVEVEMIDDKGQVVAKGLNNGYYRIVGENMRVSTEKRMEIKISMVRLSYNTGNVHVRMRFRVGKQMIGLSPFIRIIEYKLVQNMEKIPWQLKEDDFVFYKDVKPKTNFMEFVLHLLDKNGNKVTPPRRMPIKCTICFSEDGKPLENKPALNMKNSAFVGVSVNSKDMIGIHGDVKIPLRVEEISSKHNDMKFKILFTAETETYPANLDVSPCFSCPFLVRTKINKYRLNKTHPLRINVKKKPKLKGKTKHRSKSKKRRMFKRPPPPSNNFIPSLPIGSLVFDLPSKREEDKVKKELAPPLFPKLSLGGPSLPQLMKTNHMKKHLNVAAFGAFPLLSPRSSIPHPLQSLLIPQPFGLPPFRSSIPLPFPSRLIPPPPLPLKIKRPPLPPFNPPFSPPTTSLSLPPARNISRILRSDKAMGKAKLAGGQTREAITFQRKRSFQGIEKEQMDTFPNKSRRLNNNENHRFVGNRYSDDEDSVGDYSDEDSECDYSDEDIECDYSDEDCECDYSDEDNVWDYSDEEKENCGILHDHKRWEGFRTSACNYDDDLDENSEEARRITEESLVNMHALGNFSGDYCANCEYGDRASPNDESTPIIHAVDCIANLLICDSLSFLERTKPVENLVERSRKRAVEWKELGKGKKEQMREKERERDRERDLHPRVENEVSHKIFKEEKEKEKGEHMNKLLETNNKEEASVHHLDKNDPFFPIRAAQLNLSRNPLIRFEFENVEKHEIPTEGLDVIFCLHEYGRREAISLEDVEREKKTVKDIWEYAKRYAKRRKERSRLIEESEGEIIPIQRKVPFRTSEGEEYFEYRKHQLLRGHFWDMIKAKQTEI